MNHFLLVLVTIVCFLIISLSTVVFAQELEPRVLTTLPTGTNFAVGAYGYTVGDITHKTPGVTTINFKQHTFLLAYLKSFSFFGLSAKIGGILPFSSGTYNAYVGGEYQEFKYNGLSDPKLTFSFNFIGSPATKLADFKTYKPNVLAGFSLLVSMPFGEYQNEFFINPGRNSWVVRPQLGVAKYVGKWILEGYVSTWLISDNTSWLGDNTISFQPLYALKIHAIRSLKKGAWLSFNSGYGYGGRTSLNKAEVRDDEINTLRLSATIAKPIGKKQTIKIALQSDIRMGYKYDFTTLVVAYQYRWFDKMK